MTELEALLGARPNNERDWSIYESEGSIYITGFSDAAILEALDYFIANYVDETGVKMPIGERYEYRYPYDDIKIGGEDIFSFSLPETDNYSLRNIRNYISSAIETHVGWTIPT